MTGKELDDLLSQKPFLPLHLHLVDGEVVEINDARCGWIQATLFLFIKFKDNQWPVVESQRFFPLTSIVKAEQITPAK